MKKKLRIGLIGLLVCFLGVGGGLWFRANFVITAAFHEQTIELGSGSISNDIEDYLRGPIDSLESVTLDTGKVNPNKIGDYKVTCITPKKTFEYTIRVEDTTAPEVKIQEMKCMAIEREYVPSDLIEEVFDYSREIHTYFVVDDKKQETLCFDKEGTYEFSLCVADASDNIAKQDFTIAFANAPEFYLLDDRYISVGTDFDLMTYVFAYDRKDGILTEDVKVESGGYDCNTAGDYEVTYTVTNSKGVTAKQQIHIYVGEQTNYNVDLSDEELQTLIEYGYFTYKPLDEENIDKVLEITKPTLANVYTQDLLGSMGIYKITPEQTYFISIGHVGKQHNHVASKIVFWDGTVVSATPTSSFAHGDDPIAMLAIPTETIPMETLLKLKEVYVDEHALDEAYENQEVVARQLYHLFGINDVRLDDKICRLHCLSPGSDCLKEAGDNDIYLSTDHGVRSGMSGTPLFDGKGRILATLGGHLIVPGKPTIDYWSRIDQLDELLSNTP